VSWTFTTHPERITRDGWILEQEVKRAIIAGIATGVVSTLLVLAGAPVAQAEDPIFVDWTSSLPSAGDTSTTCVGPPIAVVKFRTAESGPSPTLFVARTRQ